MSKTTYVVCAINMVASAIALFLIFRSQPKPTQLPLQRVASAKAAEPSISPIEIWTQFEQTTSLQTAANVLAKLPPNEASLAKTVDYIRENNAPNANAVDFAATAKVGACIRFLGMHGQWDSPHRLLLQSIAQDQQFSVIVRDFALRAVVDVAMRKHAMKGADDGTWRTQLADFLMTDFGNGTSIEGLALQAAVFLHNQSVASIDNSLLAARVRTILKNSATVQESTLLAALEVSASLKDANLAEAIRAVIQNPRSDALLQMAVFALGKVGTSDDQSWLITHIPLASPALYRTTEAAWLGLNAPAPNEGLK